MRCSLSSCALALFLVPVGCSSGDDTTAASGQSGSGGYGATGGGAGPADGVTSGTGAAAGTEATSSVGSGGAAASGGTGGGGSTASPSGEPMPVGDLPGWKQIFADDFTTDASLGNFPGAAYAAGWTAYQDGWHDTSGNGEYSPGKTLSVSGGLLNINVHTENGVHYVSAPEPMSGQGQVYGRYSIRFRATMTTGDYKTAWLLWPESDVWPDDGEIDFPEGTLDGDFSAYAHYADPGGGQDAFENTGATYTSWHTATTEWAPGSVTFFVDGNVIGTSTTEVPSKSMRYVLQTETKLSGGAPSDNAVGNIEIDWVVIWAKN